SPNRGTIAAVMGRASRVGAAAGPLPDGIAVRCASPRGLRVRARGADSPGPDATVRGRASRPRTARSGPSPWPCRGSGLRGTPAWPPRARTREARPGAIGYNTGTGREPCGAGMPPVPDLSRTTRGFSLPFLHRRIASRLRFHDYLKTFRSGLRTARPARADAEAPPAKHRSLGLLYRELYRLLTGHRPTLPLAPLGLPLATPLTLTPPP